MAESRTLERECATLSRYLVGAEATPPCVEAYLRANGAADGDRASGAASIDRWTVWLGRRGGAATRIADAYCSLFRRGGPLRRKVTLALAVLEHAPPHHTALHAGSGTGPVRTWLSLFTTGLVFSAALLAGLVVCGPVHLISTRTGRSAPDG